MNLKTKVSDNQAFYVKDGPVIKSVKELSDALENNNISDESFQYHINNNDNDFVNWIKGVYGEEKLAKKLKRVKKKDTFIKNINESLK